MPWERVSPFPFSLLLLFTNTFKFEFRETLETDVSGEYADAEHQLYKTRLDKDGNEVHTEKLEALNAAKTNTSDHDETKEIAKVECGSCYGAETEELKCCNSCEDVLNAYRAQGWGIRDPRAFDQCKAEGVRFYLSLISR